MDQKTAEMWLKVIQGSEKLSWSLWMAPIMQSRQLTAEGKNDVLRILSILPELFGDSWIEKCFRCKHPIVSLRYSPQNDVPSVYYQLLTLSLQLTLLNKTPGIKQVMKNLFRNLEDINWHHALLQMETAALALQSGHSAFRLESSENGVDVDMVLALEGQNIYFEMVSMGTDQVYRWTSAYWQAITDLSLQLRIQYDVNLTGHMGDQIDNEQDLREWITNNATWRLNLQLWLHEIEQRAIDVAKTGKECRISTPFGGKLVLSVKPLPVGETFLTGSALTQNEWNRVEARIRDKARQTIRLNCVWIRMDDLGALWRLTHWAQLPLNERLTMIVPLIQEALAPYSHISGMVISNHFDWQPVSMKIEKWVWHDCGAAIRIPFGDGRFKETIVVCRGASAHRDMALLLDWYEREATWLDWALSQHGYAPFQEIFSAKG